ncbi:hypothetical protein GCM10012275_60520 [Longimycelium tulufanense]|uniref:Methyltransferase domain-containing protein n=1 Tax=Longimycelium tulufanense TaxID=907463 RepID=A0A8J3CK44_9PSEU|nr:hypothetical protein GCM10012275_60520 [Longimycelium tulufanense]
MTACDVSEDMLHQADRKPLASHVRFFVADMRHLPDVGTFDVVTCIDDAVNHLLTAEDVRLAFRSVRRLLKPGGLYLFDVNTITTYRTFWSQTAVSDCGDAFFARVGRTPPDIPRGGEAQFTLECFRHNRSQWDRSSVDLRQRHYDEDTIRRLLSQSGLTPVASAGLHESGTVDRHINEDWHTKAIHIARATD